jgi:microcystin-dependent protein
MLVTNQTNQDYWFGPLHLAAGVGRTLTVDDTTATSLYLTSDAVADAINNLYNSNKITVSSAAAPFPRPTGTPQLMHGDGSPEGLVYAPQGSLYMRRDGTLTNGGMLYLKTTGVTFNTGWLDLTTATGANVVSPTGTITFFGGSAAPTGWLICDGSAISRATYSTLFGVISTNYGAGDGSTTFNLPDLRGRVPVGWAAAGGHTDVSALGNNDLVALGNRRPKHRTSLSDPGHNHGVNDPSHNHQSDYPAGDNSGGGSSSPGQGGTTHTTSNSTTGIWLNSQTTGITVGTGVSTDPLDTPAYIVANHIIKT